MKTSLTIFLLTLLSMTWASCSKDKGGNAEIETFVTTSPPPWGNAGGGVYRTTVPVPSLTQDVLDRGMVSVWITFSASTYPPRLIPLTYTLSSGDIMSIWYDAEPGQVTINYRLQPVGSTYGNLNYVKVVLVKPL